MWGQFEQCSHYIICVESVCVYVPVGDELLSHSFPLHSVGDRL